MKKVKVVYLIALIAAWSLVNAMGQSDLQREADSFKNNLKRQNFLDESHAKQILTHANPYINNEEMLSYWMARIESLVFNRGMSDEWFVSLYPDDEIEYYQDQLNDLKSDSDVSRNPKAIQAINKVLPEKYLEKE